MQTDTDSSISRLPDTSRLTHLSTRDLVLLLFQVTACALPLRWRVAGMPDAELLRREIRRREFETEAGR